MYKNKNCFEKILIRLKSYDIILIDEKDKIYFEKYFKQIKFFLNRLIHFNDSIKYNQKYLSDENKKIAKEISEVMEKKFNEFPKTLKDWTTTKKLLINFTHYLFGDKMDDKGAFNNFKQVFGKIILGELDEKGEEEALEVLEEVLNVWTKDVILNQTTLAAIDPEERKKIGSYIYNTYFNWYKLSELFEATIGKISVSKILLNNSHLTDEEICQAVIEEFNLKKLSLKTFLNEVDDKLQIKIGEKGLMINEETLKLN